VPFFVVQVVPCLFVVHVQVLLPRLPWPESLPCVNWQFSWPVVPPLQTGSLGQLHVGVGPCVLPHKHGNTHPLQVAASAPVVPNANNDIEVSNNNEGTRNMGLSVMGGGRGSLPS